MADADLPQSAQRVIGRLFFGTTSIAALVCAVILSMLSVRVGIVTQVALIGGLIAFATLSGLAVRASTRPQFPMTAALCTTAVIEMALAGPELPDDPEFDPQEVADAAREDEEGAAGGEAAEDDEDDRVAQGAEGEPPDGEDKDSGSR